MVNRGSSGTAVERRTQWSRAAVATGLFAVAAAWPLLNLGSRKTTLLVITEAHGVETSDLLAAIPLVGAVLILVTPWQRRMSIRSSLLIAAFGVGAGIATGFAIHKLT